MRQVEKAVRDRNRPSVEAGYHISAEPAIATTWTLSVIGADHYAALFCFERLVMHMPAGVRPVVLYPAEYGHFSVCKPPEHCPKFLLVCLVRKQNTIFLTANCE